MTDTLRLKWSFKPRHFKNSKEHAVVIRIFVHSNSMSYILSLAVCLLRLITMKRPQQLNLIPTDGHLQYCHGGELRKKRRGRKLRPLATKNPLHLVLKCNKTNLNASLRSYENFKICNEVIKKYAKHFFVKIEGFTIQNDHIHFILRASRRSSFQNFFRVVAGQIAQQLHKRGLAKVSTIPKPQTKRAPKTLRLWKWRPFTRVVNSYKALLDLIDYLKLNELEAIGKIKYQKNRLRDLDRDWLRKVWDENFGK